MEIKSVKCVIEKKGFAELYVTNAFKLVSSTGNWLTR